MATRGDRAAGSSAREIAQRLSAGYNKSLVRSGRHSLFLLADSGIFGTCCLWRHWRARARHKTVLRPLPPEKGSRTLGMAGRSNSGLPALGSDSTHPWQRLRVLGGRRRRTGESIHHRRNCYRSSWSARRLRRDFAAWLVRIALFAARTANPVAYPSRVALFSPG